MVCQVLGTLSPKREPRGSFFLSSACTTEPLPVLQSTWRKSSPKQSRSSRCGVSPRPSHVRHTANRIRMALRAKLKTPHTPRLNTASASGSQCCPTGALQACWGFYQFSMQGLLHKAQAEFKLVCLALNLGSMGVMPTSLEEKQRPRRPHQKAPWPRQDRK